MENRDATCGAALFVLDGNYSGGAITVRNPKDRQVRLVYSDGRVLRKVDSNGPVFLHYDGVRAISLNSSANRTHTLHALQNGKNSLELWQVVALGYLIHPDRFKLTEEEMKAQRDDAAATEKAEDEKTANRLFGEFNVLNSNTNTFGQGKATVKKVGPYLHMSYAFQGGNKLQGIGVHFNPGKGDNNEQIFTSMSADGAVALGVYGITDGKLNGTWYPTTLLADGKAALGTEALSGKTGDDLTGRFTITAAKTPGKGDAYTGTLDVAKMRRTNTSSTPAYYLQWTVGGVKLYGVGVQVELFGKDQKTRKYLVVAAGTSEVVLGQHFWDNSSGVHLDFVALGKTIAGDETNGGYILLNR